MTENRYLLKVWSEPGLDEESRWRATLRDVRDGTVTTFRDSEELVKYLTSGLASNQHAGDERG